MKNSLKQSTKSKVRISQLGAMLQLVSKEYPKYSKDYVKLAELISEDFDVICTAADIGDYERMHVVEDYELESKRHIFRLFNGSFM